MFNDNPLISVIIPIYNQEKGIEKTIQSVVKQTYTNIEIILVDDGSIDRSLSICRRCANDDKRIKLYSIQNSGVVEARRYAADRATGAYIHYLDGGDYISPNTYTTLVANASQSKYPDIVLFGFYYVDDTKEDKSQPYPKDITTPKSLLKHIFTTQQYHSMWQYIHKTELIKGMDYDNSLTLAEDLYYTTQIICRCKTISIVNENLLYYLFDDTSATNNGVYTDKKVECLLKVSKLVAKYMQRGGFEDGDFNFELTALKLQCYATIFLGGRTDLMPKLIDEFNSAFEQYPEIDKTGVIKCVRKLIFLYNRNRAFYHIMLRYYRYKGKIK